jgi:hypothetical protein
MAHILCKGQTAPAMLYTIVEVLPGVRLALLPGEDVTEIAERLAWFFDETERRPNMADEPTPDEAAELDKWAERDPNFTRWMAYNVQPDYMRDGYIGD